MSENFGRGRGSSKQTFWNSYIGLRCPFQRSSFEEGLCKGEWQWGREGTFITRAVRDDRETRWAWRLRIRVAPPPRFQLSIPFRYVTVPVDEKGDSLRHTRDGESEADHPRREELFSVLHSLSCLTR